MNKLYKYAIVLAIITVLYNIAEGLISVYFSYNDDSLALFGFGVDSFVEVISGMGILHMVLRMRQNPVEKRDRFEKTALLITGYSFYILSVGLLIGAVINIIYAKAPVTTIPGIVISLLSILTMYFLMKAKLNVGKKLNSDAIIADANCTKTCLFLSIVLLVSSLLFELFGSLYFDVIGVIGIAYFSFTEGKEAIEKVKTNNIKCSCGHD
ncbi:MAG: cation transporter [bacterium]